MATHEELVDLSLFAESPTSDWRFPASDLSPNYTNYDQSVNQSFPSPRWGLQLQRCTGTNLPTEFYCPQQRIIHTPQPQNTCHTRYHDPAEQRMFQPLPRSYTLKPLPPLPPKKLCKPRTSKARSEMQSRCILQRLKKARSADLKTERRGSLQQRRNLQSTPQLTLNVPSASRHRAPEMVWLPDDQIWLVMDEHERGRAPSPPQYSAPSFRPQPSPSIYSYPDTTPPLTPDVSQARNPFINADGLSPIQSQFRSLIIDEERRSPLFQEATSTVPDIDSTIEAILSQASEDDWPVYDPTLYDTPVEEPEEAISPDTPDTPDSYFDDIEREWNSAASIASGYEGSRHLHSRDTSDQSYHSAVSSMADYSHEEEEPVDCYLGHTPTPVWAGIAQSISNRKSTDTASTWSWDASTLSPEPSLSGP